MAITDFKLRFFGSTLGYLWQLMRPLMLFGVLYAVFSVLLDFEGQERFYPAALLLGLVLFGFLSETTSGAVRSIVNRENLVRKIDFPRLAVPLSVVIHALLNLGLNLIPVLVFLLAAGGKPMLSWLLVPALILAFATWTFGLAMLLSALFVRFRDIEPIWDVVMQAMFYATPIFYTLSLVEEKTGGDTAGHILMMSPFAAIVQQFRHWFIDPSHVSLLEAMDGWLLASIPIAIALLTVAVGAAVFSWMAPKVAEEL